MYPELAQSIKIRHFTNKTIHASEMSQKSAELISVVQGSVIYIANFGGFRGNMCTNQLKEMTEEGLNANFHP